MKLKCNTGYASPEKRILIFNEFGILIAIVKSIGSASKLSNKMNSKQSISTVCVGKTISAGGLYYRHLDDNIEIDLSDLGTLKIKDYDTLCSEERKYNSFKKMNSQNKRNVVKNNKNANKNNQQVAV